MSRARLVIAPGRDKALGRRHPWIFSGAVRRVEGDPQEGEVVDVVDSQGQWMATGHFQQGTIVCKVLSFDTPHINADFYRRRLQSAIDYRRRLGFFDNPHTTTFRLIHAEGDAMPGLVADWYDGVLVLQAHSQGMHLALPTLAPLFKELLGESLVAIFDKSSGTLEGCTDGFLLGKADAEREVRENDIRLMVNFYEGQKTGFFIDQRENRELLCSLSRGHRVLNCFGYTGGFSLAALQGGASYVETVDISARAIELANRNVALNFGPDAPHRGTVADVLHLRYPEQPFDLIILDPPAFAKTHRALQQGLKGYRAINRRAMEQIAPGGLLFTFSCSQAVSTDDFRTMVFSAAALAGRQVRVVRTLPHAMDHPVSIFHPEGEYLKGLLLEVE